MYLMSRLLMASTKMPLVSFRPATSVKVSPVSWSRWKKGRKVSEWMLECPILKTLSATWHSIISFFLLTTLSLILTSICYWLTCMQDGPYNSDAKIVLFPHPVLPIQISKSAPWASLMVPVMVCRISVRFFSDGAVFRMVSLEMTGCCYWIYCD